VVYREKYKAFWVFTKSKLHFEKRPVWREKIDASTFPIDNAGFKAHINTILCDKNGETLITANQEACVLDLEKHRPVKLTGLNYPKENFPEPVFTQPFEKFDSDFTEEDFKYEQVIRSQHIDMSHHMNNIEYIKLALNVFSDDFLLTHEVKNLEVHYTGESKEGQTLKIYSKTSGNTTVVVINESERCVFEMKIEF
jgi:acyl-ACP thioesterase